MPYLDLREPDNMTHLLQLFMAAHPQNREDNDAMRVHADMPEGYFVSLPLTRKIAAWARKRQLITKDAATRMVQAADMLLRDDPSTVVSVTPRRLGIPPRLQPTVLMYEMEAWVSCRPPATVLAADGGELIAFTLEAAIRLCGYMVEDPDHPDMIRQRAQRLREWLMAQGEADA